MPRHIIIQRNSPDYWSAWFKGEPQVAWSAGSMHEALCQLGKSLTVAENRRLRPVANTDEVAAGLVEIIIPDPCLDCGGTGIYVGPRERGVCQACQGTG